MNQEEINTKIENYLMNRMGSSEREVFEQELADNSSLQQQFKQEELQHQMMELLVENDLQNDINQWRKEANISSSEDIEKPKNTSSTGLSKIVLFIGIIGSMAGLVWFLLKPTTVPSNVEQGNQITDTIKVAKTDNTVEDKPNKIGKKPESRIKTTVNSSFKSQTEAFTKYNELANAYLSGNNRWKEWDNNDSIWNATKKNPEYRFIINNLEAKMNAYDKKDNDIPVATNKPTTKKPDDKVNYIALADTYEKSMEFSTFRSTATDFLNLGLDTLSKGYYEEGIHLLLKVSEDKRTRNKVKLNLGFGYYKNKDYKNAILYLKEIAENKGYGPYKNAYWPLALSYLRAGKIDKAKQFLKEMLNDKNTPDLDDVQKLIDELDANTSGD